MPILSNPISIKKKKYDLHYVTGEVLGADKISELRVSSSGGSRNVPADIKSDTVIHDNLFVLDDDGNEHSCQLSGINVAVRPGNRITAVRAIPKGKSKGAYLLVYNHSTRETFYNDTWVKKASSPHGIMWVLLPVFGYYFGKALYPGPVDEFSSAGVTFYGIISGIGFLILAVAGDIILTRQRSRAFYASRELMNALDEIRKT